MAEAAGADRTAGTLVQASYPWSKDEDTTRTWLLFGATLFVLWSAQAVAALAPWWPVRLVAALVAGLTIVRAFIFFHDHMHGAVFRKDRLGALAMELVGLLTLSPSSVWRETHDYHHRNNAKMIGATIGSYPIVTLAMWRVLKSDQRFWYRFARHPLNMLFGYFTVFSIGMCISPFLRNPRLHWRGPLALLLQVALVGGTGLLAGWDVAFFAVFLPGAVSMATGAYLFYAQHNFPAVQLRDRSQWDYTYAALNSSSMMDMPGFMHWFTGNIGYHHVHHLNHRIPFYRLPEAMAGVPELREPGRTSLTPSAVWQCLQLAVWDTEKGRMVTWPELRALGLA
jgi:omega-6 fatty acid desaturase (delta-12 desaturase)